MSRRCIQGLLGFILLLACGFVGAQPDVARWMASHLPPQGPDASALAQTPDGFLWVGEGGAVVRFDGVQWREFHLPPSSPPNVDDLLVDPTGQLWIGNGHQLLRMEGDAIEVVASVSPEDAAIRRLRWVDGALHLATTHGVYRFDPPASLHRIVDVEGSTVFDLIRQAPDQPLLVGGIQGLFAATDHGIEARATGTREDLITSLEPDGEDGLWLGGYVLRRLTQRGEIEPVPAPARWVRRMAMLSNGELWVGTHSDGLYIRSPAGAWRRGDRRLHGELVYAIFEDRERNVWVATAGSGVHRFALVGMEEIQFEDGLPTRLLSSIAAGSDGDVWLATYGRGLLNLSAARVLTPVDTPCGDALVSLVRQAPDTLWVGGEEGLCRVRAGEVERVASAGKIQALALASNDALWVMDETGLRLLAEGEVRQHVPRPDGPEDRPVSAMLDDGEGGVWLADAEGLSHLGPTGRKTVDARGPVRALWPATEGGLWLLQNEQLVLRNADGTRHATPSLPGAWLLWGDGAGMLWQVSRSGTARADESRLRRRLEAGLPAPSLEVFGSSEGHGGSNATQIGTPQWTSLPDGGMAYVMFGQVRIGRLASDPWKAPPPQARIESVSAPGIDAAESGHAFSPERWPIRISYTAAALRAPQALRFRYRLLPLDSAWSSATQERSQSFARLAPGDYRFEVAVEGEGEGASAAASSFAFSVLPLWYEARWVHVLIGVVTLVLGALATMWVQRWRMRGLTERQRELELLVATRTQALQDANRQLAVQARTDALTGLLNRRAFLDTYAYQWQVTHRDGEPIAVLIIDVDHFKTYNDQHGHVAGDETLRRIAHALTRGLHWPDGLVARDGGEEFVVTLPRARLDQALTVGEAMRAAVADMAIAHRGGHEFGIVTVSIGAAVSEREDDLSAEALLIRADVALYEAKHAGRNRVRASQG